MDEAPQTQSLARRMVLISVALWTLTIALTTVLGMTMVSYGEHLYVFSRMLCALLIGVPPALYLFSLARRGPYSVKQGVLSQVALMVGIVPIFILSTINQRLDSSPGVATRYVFQEYVVPRKGQSYAIVHPLAFPDQEIRFHHVVDAPHEHQQGDVFVAVKHSGALGFEWVEVPGRWVTR